MLQQRSHKMEKLCTLFPSKSTQFVPGFVIISAQILKSYGKSDSELDLWALTAKILPSHRCMLVPNMGTFFLGQYEAWFLTRMGLECLWLQLSPAQTDKKGLKLTALRMKSSMGGDQNPLFQQPPTLSFPLKLCITQNKPFLTLSDPHGIT